MNTEIKHISIMNEVADFADLASINFVAIIMTSWHLDNLIAYLRINQLFEGILIVSKLPSVDYRLYENQVNIYKKHFKHIFFCENHTASYNYRNLCKSLFRKSNKSFRIIRPHPTPSLRVISLFISPKRKLTYVETDEGRFSWMASSQALNLAWGKKSWLHKRIRLLQIAIIQLFSSILIDEKEKETFLLKTKDKLLPNQPICCALKEIYSERVEPVENAKTVLIFKDNLIVSEENTKQIFDVLLKSLINNNLKIIIKKHPGDINSDFDDYIKANYQHVEIIRNIQSGEEMVAMYKPEMIVGGSSTVIFSSALIFHVKTLSYMLLYKGLEKIDCEDKEIERFYENFKEIIHFPASLNDLEYAINHLYKL
ncbi:MAG: alpha-2,8-polysialyltransferase family protein [Prevotellaceae bacterium]|jgi:hypothetical protein|nr:alpha-2,8-polysialyltransferase family protein [Prevotellaceae bacterium]